MNCPNCAGNINLAEKRCEYCDTAFTDEELKTLKEGKASVKMEKKTLVEDKKPLNMTEKKKQELQKDRAEHKANTSQNDSNDIAIGATVMGSVGLFAGIRGFFWNFKRTIFTILFIALEIGFAFLMISTVVTKLLQGELEGFIAVNIIILAHALVAGFFSRMGWLRFGVPVATVMNFLAVVWVFVYPILTSGFDGMEVQWVAVFALSEMAVLAVSSLFAGLIYRR